MLGSRESNWAKEVLKLVVVFFLSKNIVKTVKQIKKIRALVSIFACNVYSGALELKKKKKGRSSLI